MPFTDEQVQTVLRRYVESRDSIGIINRGHQFIVSSLKELIFSYGAESHNPKHIKGLNFSHLLTMVDCLGLLTDAEYKLLAKLNWLRNQIDHYDHEPTVKDEADFYELWFATNGTIDRKVTDKYNPVHFPQLFTVLIGVTYNILSHRALNVADKRLTRIVDTFMPGVDALPMIEMVYHHAILGGTDPKELIALKMVSQLLNKLRTSPNGSGIYKGIPIEKSDDASPLF